MKLRNLFVGLSVFFLLVACSQKGGGGASTVTTESKALLEEVVHFTEKGSDLPDPTLSGGVFKSLVTLGKGDSGLSGEQTTLPNEHTTSVSGTTSTSGGSAPLSPSASALLNKCSLDSTKSGKKKSEKKAPFDIAIASNVRFVGCVEMKGKDQASMEAILIASGYRTASGRVMRGSIFGSLLMGRDSGEGSLRTEKPGVELKGEDCVKDFSCGKITFDFATTLNASGDCVEIHTDGPADIEDLESGTSHHCNTTIAQKICGESEVSRSLECE